MKFRDVKPGQVFYTRGMLNGKKVPYLKIQNRDAVNLHTFTSMVSMFDIDLDCEVDVANGTLALNMEGNLRSL